jgi:hypothetical protein
VSGTSEAAAQLQKKDEAGAVATYASLASDTSADPAFRNLATILEVQHSMETGDAKALEAKLTPLIAPNNSFSASALELSALLAAKQGDIKRAQELAEQILSDSGAPAGARQRATDLAALYKGQLGDAAPATPTPVSASPAPTPSAAPAPATPAAPAPAKPAATPVKP